MQFQIGNYPSGFMAPRGLEYFTSDQARNLIVRFFEDWSHPNNIPYLSYRDILNYPRFQHDWNRIVERNRRRFHVMADKFSKDPNFRHKIILSAMSNLGFSHNNINADLFEYIGDTLNGLDPSEFFPPDFPNVKDPFRSI